MCPVLCYASILCTPPLYKGVGPGNIQLSPARLLYETWPSRHGLHLAALGLQHRPWGLPNPTSRKPTFHSATLVQLHSTTPNTCGTQLSLQTKSKLNSIQTQLNSTQLNPTQLSATQTNSIQHGSYSRRTPGSAPPHSLPSAKLPGGLSKPASSLSSSFPASGLNPRPQDGLSSRPPGGLPPWPAKGLSYSWPASGLLSKPRGGPSRPASCPPCS